MKEDIIKVNKAISEIGIEIFENLPRLSSIILDLVEDEKLKKLLIFSIKEGITRKIFKLYTMHISPDELEIKSLRIHTKDDTFLTHEAIDMIFDFWLKVIYSDFFLFLIPIENEDKWGFCNQEKELIINCLFDYALPFSSGLSAVLIQDKWGYINKKGEFELQPTFKHAGSFNDGIAKVVVDTNLWGYINKKGEYVIKPYSVDGEDKQNELNDGLVRVFDTEHKKFGFKNLNNELVIDYLHDKITSFSEGIAILGSEYQPKGYIDKNGRILKLVDLEYAYPFSNNRGLIKKNGKYGFIDINGNIVIDAVYEDSKSFSDGLAAVCKNGRWGYIDINGNTKIQNTYLSAERFSEERAFVLKKSGWGFIDKEGNEYSTFDYFNFNILGLSMEFHGYWSSPMHCFKDGLAIVSRFVDSKDINRLAYGEKESKFGFVDIWGNEVIECKYPPIDSHFEDGLAHVGYYYNGGWCYSCFGYIDKLGNTYGFELRDADEYYDYE